MKESDLQPPKPLWHEDTRGRPNGGRGGGPAGPLSSAAHRMLNHTMQVPLELPHAAPEAVVMSLPACMHT